MHNDYVPVNKKLQKFGSSIFSMMTQLAIDYNAINLAQGFPDFESPVSLKEFASRAIFNNHNQYARSMGCIPFVEAISEKVNKHYGIKLNYKTEITTFSGATEGIFSSLMGLSNDGDEVIVFEPFYDSYTPSISMCGLIPKFYRLNPPDYNVLYNDLEQLITPSTKIILLNTPHNPTGKVFSEKELKIIGDLAIKHNLYIISDEVYEHITFSPIKHVPIAKYSEYRDRVITISSIGKTFSVTGWKIGYAFGPEQLIASIQSAHQFITFSSATPFQMAMADYLKNLSDDYYNELENCYRERRDFLSKTLIEAGFSVISPDGTYFILADISNFGFPNDVVFSEYLTKNIGVACIPVSAFYSDHINPVSNFVRFAFCKKMETLKKAEICFKSKKIEWNSKNITI